MTTLYTINEKEAELLFNKLEPNNQFIIRPSSSFPEEKSESENEDVIYYTGLTEQVGYATKLVIVIALYCLNGII